MGSLPINGNGVSKFASTTSTTSGTISSLFLERSKSRSPIQSPPLPKRILHLVDAGKVGSKASDNSLIRHSGYQDIENRGRGNKSILKTGSPRRSRSRVDHNRKVNFRPKVVVFHFDRDQGGHVSCESLILNAEPEVRGSSSAVAHLFNRQNNTQTTILTSSTTTLPGFVLTNHNATTERHSQMEGPGTPRGGGTHNDTPTPRRRSLPSLKNQEESLPAIRDLHFQHFVDDSRNSFLRFSLPLGSGTSANDVIVKANKNGDRVRVFGGSGSTSNQKRREVCERFSLPVRVDAYQINARIDSTGVLFVEAPILQGELLKPGLQLARKSV